MSRLTNTEENRKGTEPISYWLKDSHPLEQLEAFKKLADYEDKEEQGLLFIAPCKVGDTIHLPWIYNGQRGIASLKVTKIVIVTGVMRVFTDFTTDDEGFFEKFNGGMFDFSDFGEIVFLTRSEAEEALARMKGE